MRCAGHCAARSKSTYFSSDFARTPASDISLVISPVSCQIFLSTSFSVFRISSVRRLVHLMCCRTNFCRVCLRWRNPNPCMVFRVAPLILSLACGGSASASAVFNREILCRKLFWVLFLCSFFSAARLHAFHALINPVAISPLLSGFLVPCGSDRPLLGLLGSLPVLLGFVSLF